MHAHVDQVTKAAFLDAAHHPTPPCFRLGNPHILVNSCPLHYTRPGPSRLNVLDNDNFDAFQALNPPPPRNPRSLPIVFVMNSLTLWSLNPSPRPAHDRGVHSAHTPLMWDRNAHTPRRPQYLKTNQTGKVISAPPSTELDRLHRSNPPKKGPDLLIVPMSIQRGI